jgi:stearoyl-CoA desaturase (delta-9 desaturase)
MPELSARIWEKPWWHCAPGEGLTFGWIVGLHVLTVVGLVLLPLPSLTVLAVSFALLVCGGLGTTVCYHRALAHRSLTLNPVIEQVLILFAVLNGSGNPRTWAAMHRLHHATSDGENDISSPHHGGFWWAHLRWLWQAPQAPSEKFKHDLNGWRLRFWDKAQVPVVALSCFGGLMWSGATVPDVLAACLWLGPIRLLYALHVQCSVNSLCHLGPITATHGSSRNLWWLTLAHLGQGENWHANHHKRPVDPRLGYGWQVDVGWWVSWMLSTCRLARLRAGAGGSAVAVKVPSSE